MHDFSTTWVIIPAYNEEKYIQPVLEKIKKNWRNIIVVDDGSQDKTYELAKKSVTHTLRHRINLGKGSALKTGSLYAFEKLGAQNVIFFDADDQHDSTLLPVFAEALENHEVVLGVRAFDNRMPFIRILLNRVGSLFVLFLFGAYIPDIPCGFKALSKRAFQLINWQSNDYAVEMEIAAKLAKHKLDFTTISIPTIYHDLDRGMNFLDTLAIVRQLVEWRLTK